MMQMNIEELIKKYHLELKTSKDKKTTTAAIIKRVDSLIYTESKKPITITDKKRILTGLKQESLLESKKFFAQDNKDHLELIDQAISSLGGKK